VAIGRLPGTPIRKSLLSRAPGNGALLAAAPSGRIERVVFLNALPDVQCKPAKVAGQPTEGPLGAPFYRSTVRRVPTLRHIDRAPALRRDGAVN